MWWRNSGPGSGIPFLETAAGEDELPNIWISNVFEDVVLASLKFAGTWAWVMLPASFWAVIEFINFGDVHWKVVLSLAAAGVFFWPVVVLGVCYALMLAAFATSNKTRESQGVQF